MPHGVSPHTSGYTESEIMMDNYEKSIPREPGPGTAMTRMAGCK